MTRLKFILIFCCSMLFLGMLISDSSAILLEYQNKENNGFIEGDVYSIERYDTEKVFSSYEELVELAKRKADSFVLIAEVSDHKMGIYFYNSEWNVPLSSGRIFTEEEMNSKETFIIDSSSPERVGTSFKDTYVNLYSLPLTFENGFSNVAILSDIPLSDRAVVNARKLTDTLFEEKQVYFRIIYYGMIVLIFLIVYQMNKSELIIRKLLGHSIVKVFHDFFLKLFSFFVISYGIAFVAFFLFAPWLFYFDYTRAAIGKIMLLRFVLIEMINLFCTLVLALIYRFTPVQRLKELNVYDN